MAIIEVTGLHKTFKSGRSFFGQRRRVTAVDNVGFELEAGEILGLVGESGCGKTTLMKIICGSLRADSGSVMLGGRSASDFSRLDRAKYLQIVQQDPYSSLNPRKTALSNVTLPLRVRGDSSLRDCRQQGLAMMERVGLAKELAEAYPNELSGGQRQRVAIARAIVGLPSILICDEPTSALDVSVQAQVLNLLSDLQQELGLSMIFVSHNLDVVRYMSHRVLVMYRGQIIEEAAAQDLFRQPIHPYTKLLLESVLTLERRQSDNELLGPSGSATLQSNESGCCFVDRCIYRQNPCFTTAPQLAVRGDRSYKCHFPE